MQLFETEFDVTQRVVGEEDESEADYRTCFGIKEIV
jgi:hypothetical protein